MKPTPIDSVEEEDGILFKVLRVTLGNEIYEANEFAIPEYYCKVIIKSNFTTRTHYFNNGVETSKERIIQDERIKSLRR